MIEHEVAKTYSQALYELAVEEDKLVEYLKNLTDIKDVINENNDLKDFLYHPRVKAEDKKQIMQKIFAGDLPQLLYNFLFLLFDKGREVFFEDILHEYRNMVNKKENIKEIEVISAVPLSEKYREQLINKLNNLLNCKIVLQTTQDPDIIGGLIIKVDDYVLDGSIKNSLNSLMEKITNIPVSKLGV